jgi:amidase
MLTDILERDTLGAFCRHTHVALAGAPSGPLAGLNFGLKDIYDVEGHRTGFGSPDWLRTHEAATASTSILTRLLAAGASMVGKTHTEEMAFSLTGENAHYGTPINPAAPGRVPGGSSSGSASAVAGGLVDFAVGSDTGGSVRAPASFCGIYGLRPTHGRIPMDHTCPLAPGFDTCGWFARDADMLARVGSVLLGGRAAPPGRLLIAVDGFAQAMPAAADALGPAVRRITANFGGAEEVVVSAEGLAAWFDVFRVLQFGEINDAHGAWVHREQPTFGAQIRPRFEAVMRSDAGEVARMRVVRDDLRGRLDALLADQRVLLLPTMPDIAPLLGASPEATVTFREHALGLLCIAGLGGLPQISLPVATLDGCPLGISLIAGRGQDEMLLELARALA